VPYIEVTVVNSIALRSKLYTTDLLIVDEIHLMVAEQFSNVFRLVMYKWVLGLTATIDRLDGKHTILQTLAPVCETITQADALSNNWVSNFVEVNLPVYFNRDELEHMSDMDRNISRYFSKFGDFGVMRDCTSYANAVKFSTRNYPGEDPYVKAKEVMKWAHQCGKMIRDRQNLLYNNEGKIQTTLEVIKKLDLKTITFSQSTEFADKIAGSLGDRAVTYHSNIKSKEVLVTYCKSYKTEKSAIKFANNLLTSVIKYENSVYNVYYDKLCTVGPSTLLKEAIAKIKDNRSKVKTICTAKALDQGADIADMELGIDSSRSSNPTQHIQRVGRICRKYTYKDGKQKRGVYINLYIPQTRDEVWLRSCQKNNPSNVIWVNTIDECISIISNSLI
jgi:superfamily II DNA or RNA helicase